MADRFTHAIEHLGSDKIEIRLGGIYNLESVARDSEKDHWTIMEILTAYIRKNSSILTATGQKRKKLKPVTFDVQTILTVIGRREVNFDPPGSYLNLNSTNLKGASLSKANLKEAHLHGANLQAARLVAANLQGAQLPDANLEGAILVETNLQAAFLIKANLKETSLQRANLSKAILNEANLQEASLHEANLQEASLDRANLKGAIFNKANLQKVSKFTLLQLSTVCSLFGTKFDDQLYDKLQKEFPNLLGAVYK
jgi:hypothetical protein